MRSRLLIQWIVIVSCCTVSSGWGAEEVLFGRDVLPILSDRCLSCHGPDESHREAELRLDLREEATRERDGSWVIKPGDPARSELLARIKSTDPDLRMPPKHAHRKVLTTREIAILESWIEQGAKWGKHWSFEKPVRPEIPDDTNPIDLLVKRRLTEAGRTLAPKADRYTLLRRVSFDLTGLPPSPEQLDDFLNDQSPDAYERLVDRLLDSPHYGERMAMWWLDAARYSDTDGYQQDATRTNWPWRDWVINAFNGNMPFDQFTIEQFAGDLLPEATPDQRLATCFHRNHMTNGEGGRDPEESRVDYVIDRINTTGTVWLGLTLGCCQCHSHKFDPISQHDYYSLSAFFNSIDEDGKAGRAAKPYLKYQSPYIQQTIGESQALVNSRKAVLDATLRQAEEEFKDWVQEKLTRVKEGFEPWHILHPHELHSVEGTFLKEEADGTIQASGPNPFQDDYRIIARTDLTRMTGLRLEIFPHESHTGGKLSRGATGEFILTDVKLQIHRAGSTQLRDIEFSGAVADAETDAKAREYGKVADTLDDDPRNGWTTASHDPMVPHVAVFSLTEPLALRADEELIFVMLQRSTQGDSNIGRFRISVTDQPGPAVKSLEPMPLQQLALADLESASELDDPLRKRLLEQFLADHAEYQRVKREFGRAADQLNGFKKQSGELNVMVLEERQEPRQSYVLERGVWDKHGEEVQRRFPDAILARADNEEATRLDLARWLVDPENPLTARVIVNQFWQLCFGAGLVRTPEDFGLQGEFPTHPDLLDWLAVELMDSGWNIKHVLKLIVTSETYQQSSHATADLLEIDPENRLLARGARFRLPAWMIRDAALKSSGLLNPSLGGPPVMPYQPEGVWEEIFMGRFRYEPSQGPAQHRRTVYAFWRRSSAPTFLFDSAQRRTCEVRPRQTNTPLHALTLLNDHTLLEASRELAKQAMSGHETSDARIRFLASSILSRPLEETELKILKREMEKARQQFDRHPGAAESLLDFGQPELIPQDNLPEIASLLITASMLYNLDEAMTHE